MLSACTDSDLAPFSSDGCSLFPDTSFISSTDWCECCFEHDIAYWRGGTAEERKAADLALRVCVVDRTKNEKLARVMYEGVRAGGSPYFYNWYRWGYGWGYERKYQRLTRAEIKRADELLAAYFDSPQPKVCSVEIAGQQ